MKNYSSHIMADKFIRLYLLNTFMFSYFLSLAQNVSIGHTAPVVKLDIRGTAASPTIPGFLSTGILRVGVTSQEGIDIGKMGDEPWSGWIQSGIAGTFGDPLSIQPLGGNVGIGTTNPHSSAQLELQSTSQGFLPPRMTLAQRNGIQVPAAGLMIWCSNCGVSGEIQVCNGTSWTNMLGGPPNGIAVGDNYGGGKVAYILQSGDPGYIAGEIHGLIAAPGDQSTAAEWGCYGADLIAAEGTALGTGYQNTINIVDQCPDAGIAARICDNLVLGGYSDWYLPSKDELNKLYLNRVVIGGFANNFYWSSSESSEFLPAYLAFVQSFNNGLQTTDDKDDPNYVRAIRAF